MAGKSFIKDLRLALINEGGFLEDADVEFVALQKDMLRFREEHGPMAEGAKAKLTIQVTVECQDVETNSFRVLTEIKRTVPVRPKRGSLAMGHTDETGHTSLLVTASGSADGDPLQGKFKDQKAGAPLP